MNCIFTTGVTKKEELQGQISIKIPPPLHTMNWKSILEFFLFCIFLIVFQKFSDFFLLKWWGGMIYKSELTKSEIRLIPFLNKIWKLCGEKCNAYQRNKAGAICGYICILSLTVFWSMKHLQLLLSYYVRYLISNTDVQSSL